MRLKIITSICVGLCLAGAILAQDKGTDPVSGVWFGYYGTSPRDQAQVRVILNWDGKVLTGSVDTGDDPFDLKNATFNPDSGLIHMEVETPGNGRSTYHYVIDGKLETDTITGGWHHQSAKGDFKISKIG
jgi:hypothetical protein